MRWFLKQGSFCKNHYPIQNQKPHSTFIFCGKQTIYRFIMYAYLMRNDIFHRISRFIQNNCDENYPM